MDKQQTPTWTKPYCGVSHFGRRGDERYASLTERDGGWCDVVFWSKHISAFESPEVDFDTVAEGKVAAETWVTRAVLPSVQS